LKKVVKPKIRLELSVMLSDLIYEFQLICSLGT